MQEAKTLTPLEYRGFSSCLTEVHKIAQKVGYPNVGNNSLNISIDTLTANPLKTTLKKAINKLNFGVEKVKSHSKISANAKKRLFTKEVTSSCYIVTETNFKNILIETPHALNQSSNYRKCRLTAFGLSQPNKPVTQSTIDELQKLFNKLDIVSLDISFDSEIPIDIHPLKEAFGKITKDFTTSYINDPIGLSYIPKICYYDKQAKDNLLHPLYRLELTCKTKGRLSSLFVPIDEIKAILEAL